MARHVVAEIRRVAPWTFGSGGKICLPIRSMKFDHAAPSPPPDFDYTPTFCSHFVRGFC